MEGIIWHIPDSYRYQLTICSIAHGCCLRTGRTDGAVRANTLAIVHASTWVAALGAASAAATAGPGRETGRKRCESRLIGWADETGVSHLGDPRDIKDAFISV